MLPKNNGKEPTIKDDEDGNSDDIQIIDVVTTHFDLLEAIETRKTSKKSRLRNHGTKDQDLPSSNATSEVSTSEPISEGTIPAAEFNGVEDETEDLHLYLDRFSAFQQMIDLFCEENPVKNFSFQLVFYPLKIQISGIKLIVPKYLSLLSLNAYVGQKEFSKKFALKIVH